MRDPGEQTSQRWMRLWMAPAQQGLDPPLRKAERRRHSARKEASSEELRHGAMLGRETALAMPALAK